MDVSLLLFLLVFMSGMGLGINAIIKTIMKSRRHERGFILRTNAYAAVLLFLLGIMFSSIGDQSPSRDNLIFNVGYYLSAILTPVVSMIPSFLLDLFLGRGKGKKISAEVFK
ncbi:MAG: hypothetical protein JKY34_09275 [Kordiimonadaceae bacterium]|nr:hypothetical protein [Kordiimonadaceae bacterium]